MNYHNQSIMIIASGGDPTPNDPPIKFITTDELGIAGAGGIAPSPIDESGLTGNYLRIGTFAGTYNTHAWYSTSGGYGVDPSVEGEGCTLWLGVTDWNGKPIPTDTGIYAMTPAQWPYGFAAATGYRTDATSSGGDIYYP